MPPFMAGWGHLSSTRLTFEARICKEMVTKAWFIYICTMLLSGSPDFYISSGEIIFMASSDETKRKRPSWDEYFMEVADTISKRSTCDRGMIGCVAARDKRLLVSGYAGSPQGLPHCDDVGHLWEERLNADGSKSKHCIRTVHAEQNAICQAAKLGIALEGATMYLRMTPCRTCAMMIINVGIVRVVCERRYHAGAESEKMFAEAGIKLEYVYDEVQEYPAAE
jgi:dCMP deaminase